MLWYLVSAEPLPQIDSEEIIARNYVDSLVSRFKEGSFIFVDYGDRTYPGIAKLINVGGLSFARVDIINPPTSEGLVGVVLRKRPGVVRLKMDSSIKFARRIYAKLDENRLEQLSYENLRLAQSADTI